MASLAILGLFGVSALLAAAPSEPNVIYGMHSGLALLMDVYQPAQPNGYGIVAIPGSGWHAAPEYGARPLKEWKDFGIRADRIGALDGKPDAEAEDPVDRESANRRRNRLRHQEESTACIPRWGRRSARQAPFLSLLVMRPPGGQGERVNWASHAEEWFDAHLRK